jgi:ATPase subunit of ABC transporter with duplicated ATPase domains
VLLVISHDRHFLNSICTHIADIDYETIITYTGTYDDMVVAKTQVRSQIEAQNAQREKKIAQLNEFIARFCGRHTVQPGAVPRRKEVERLQVTELARNRTSSVPFMKFEHEAAFGKAHSRAGKVSCKSYDDKERSPGTLPRASAAVRRLHLMGRNGAGKTTLVNASAGKLSPTTCPMSELRVTPAATTGKFIDRSGKVIWGHEAR